MRQFVDHNEAESHYCCKSAVGLHEHVNLKLGCFSLHVELDQLTADYTSCEPENAPQLDAKAPRGLQTTEGWKSEHV